MKVSLILASIGRSTDVGRFIDSLIAQTEQGFELIVVDQNVDDRLVPYIENGRKAGIDLTHLRMYRPSLSGARNLGLQHAKGEVVAFPDDDCWYEPEVIETIRARFSHDSAPDGVIAQWVEQASAHPATPKSGDLSLDAWRCFRDGDASSISLFLRTKLLVQLDGFDERFGVGQWFGAAEETDLILRALATKAKLTRSPESRVHHHFSTTSSIGLKQECQQARKRARGTGAIYAKHGLGIWVIARGLIAPIMKPLVKGKLRATIRGFNIALGRIEGFWTWKAGRTA
jgi:glycosyltransferase involved in cell wall biosynthesis